MGGTSSREDGSPAVGLSAPAPAPPPSYISVRSDPIPNDTGIRVVCPRCRAVLMPPATLFRCPCGQLMTFNALQQGQSAMNMIMGAGGVAPHFRISAGNALESRIQLFLSRLPPEDPHAVFLRALLRRLPRHPNGSINIEAVDAVARQLLVVGAARRRAARGRTRAVHGVSRRLRRRRHAAHAAVHA